MKRVFFDTNVVLYLLSADPNKADRAEQLLTGGGFISVQVLNEAVSVCLKKLKLPWAEIEELLTAVQGCCQVRPLTLDTHQRGRRLAQRYQLPWYDALICATAQEAQAETLFTEDLHPGLDMEGLQVVNPFRE